MLELALKAAVSGILVAAATEAARRSTVVGAVLISLPVASILALAWLWLETGDVQRVSQFSWATMWIVLPSVVLFLALPVLLRHGLPFWLALVLSCGIMALAYVGWAGLLARLGVRL